MFRNARPATKRTARMRSCLTRRPTSSPSAPAARRSSRDQRRQARSPDRLTTDDREASRSPAVAPRDHWRRGPAPRPGGIPLPHRGTRDSPPSGRKSAPCRGLRKWRPRRVAIACRRKRKSAIGRATPLGGKAPVGRDFVVAPADEAGFGRPLRDPSRQSVAGPGCSTELVVVPHHVVHPGLLGG
jgi:hypothetical protein